MRRWKRKNGVLRRSLRHLRIGLIYTGAFAWPTAELIAARRAEAAESVAQAEGDELREEPGRLHPERIVPYADLTHAERRLLQELDEQLKRENEK